MIGLALMLALQPSPTLERVVEPGEWTFIAVSSLGDSVSLARPGNQRGRVWIRTEFETTTATRPYRSSRALVELDCAEWRTRTLQFSTFALNNLNGEAGPAGGPWSWEFAAPDTFADQYLIYGCGD